MIAIWPGRASERATKHEDVDLPEKIPNWDGKIDSIALNLHTRA